MTYLLSPSFESSIGFYRLPGIAEAEHHQLRTGPARVEIGLGPDVDCEVQGAIVRLDQD